MPIDYLGQVKGFNPLEEAISAYNTYGEAVKKRKAEDEAEIERFMKDYTTASDEQRTAMVNRPGFQKIVEKAEQSPVWSAYVKADETGNKTLTAPNVPLQIQDMGTETLKNDKGEYELWHVTARIDPRTQDFVRDDKGEIVYNRRLKGYDYGLAMQEASLKLGGSSSGGGGDKTPSFFTYKSLPQAENAALKDVYGNVVTAQKMRDVSAMNTAFITYKSYLANSPDGYQFSVEHPTEFAAYAYNKFASAFGNDPEIMAGIKSSLSEAERKALFPSDYLPPVQETPGKDILKGFVKYNQFVMPAIKTVGPTAINIARTLTAISTENSIRKKYVANIALTEQEKTWVASHPKTNARLQLEAKKEKEKKKTKTATPVKKVKK